MQVIGWKGRARLIRPRATERFSSASLGEFGDIGRDFYARGWVLGTSGNFSAVVSDRPLTLAITASAVSKGAIGAGDIVLIGPDAAPVGKRRGRPSAEALLHVTVARQGRRGHFAHALGLEHDPLGRPRGGREASPSRATRCSRGSRA